MDVQQILEIIQYVALGLSIVITVISFFYGKIKGSSSSFLTKFMGLLDELGTSVEYAEQLSQMEPTERKEFATHLIATYCANKKITINEEQLDKIVERIITTTNIVNVKERPEQIIDDLTNEDELVENNASDDAELPEDKTNNS